jgi:hypothetical protein
MGLPPLSMPTARMLTGIAIPTSEKSVAERSVGTGAMKKHISFDWGKAGSRIRCRQFAMTINLPRGSSHVRSSTGALQR